MHRWCLLNLTVPGFSLNLTVRGVSHKHCLLTFFIRFVLPPWISLYFFDICIHVIISCKNNDSVSWELKKRILFEG